MIGRVVILVARCQDKREEDEERVKVANNFCRYVVGTRVGSFVYVRTAARVLGWDFRFLIFYARFIGLRRLGEKR